MRLEIIRTSLDRLAGDIDRLCRTIGPEINVDAVAERTAAKARLRPRAETARNDSLTPRIRPCLGKVDSNVAEKAMKARFRDCEKTSPARRLKKGNEQSRRDQRIHNFKLASTDHLRRSKEAWTYKVHIWDMERA